MEYLWYCAAGIISGVLGGMGMGGGTALIPLLSIFYFVSQHSAQAVNLVSFIPMAIVALIIHIKNKFVKFNGILFVIIPGAITCIIGCYLARSMSSILLRRFFGGFLILLSIFQFVSALKEKSK